MLEDMSDKIHLDDLTDSQVTEFRKHFDAFDYRKEGAILTVDLGTVLRACGQIPTEGWIKERMKIVDPDTRGIVEWDSFLIIAKQSMMTVNPDDELLDAFRRFDKFGSGKITTSELRKILTTLGDTLSEEEVNELISDADGMGTGEVNYESLCRTLIYGPD